MDNNNVKTRDTRWIPKVRNGVAIIVVTTVSMLGGYALLFLRPGWEWTQERNEKQLEKEARDSS